MRSENLKVSNSQFSLLSCRKRLSSAKIRIVEMMKAKAENQSRIVEILIVCLVAGTFLGYYFSNPKPQYHYDYTFRIADNMLRGEIAFMEKPPSWLNEFVPFQGSWYSVFPLGSVLTMMPFAIFKVLGFMQDMPAALIAALIAGGICLFLLLISERYEYGWGKRILVSLGILFGTWMWTNLAFAGAWHLALGWAVLGELGAIYFTIFNRKPIWAGAFFALSFGNRTEILLTAPIFMFLLYKFQVSSSKFQVEEQDRQSKKIKPEVENNRKANKPETWNLKLETWAKFCLVPFVLGVSTLIYNYIRFDSFTDFGYARIPGVLNEPWYNHGIFSVRYIPRQAYEMLFKVWEIKTAFPYFVPNGFSSSILLSSPFVLFVLRFGARDKILKYTAWAAIFVLTFLLWTHGNSGGWQFGYRYAMVLLPWMFLILLENSPKKITFAEWFAYLFSFLINSYATYLFFWTDYVKP